MRQLQRIVVTGEDGLKGQTFDTQLTGCDVFCGPNGSGKTTRLLAVQLALFGLANTPTDTRRVYLGPDRPNASVTLIFNDKRLSRPLQPSKGKAVTRADAAAESICGTVVRWDLHDFATGTDSSRVRLMEEVCRAGAASAGITRESVVSTLRGACPDDALVDRLVNDVPFGGGVASWLPDAIEWARTEYTAANRAKRDAEAGASAAMKVETPTGHGTAEDAAERIAGLQGQLRTVREQVAAAKSAGDAWRRHAQQSERARVALSSAVAAHRKALDDLARLQAFELDEAPQRPALHGMKAAKLDAHVNTLRSKERAASEALGRATDALARAKGRRDQLEDMRDRSTACRKCGDPDPLGLADALAIAVDLHDVAETVAGDAHAERRLVQAELDRAAAEQREFTARLQEVDAAIEAHERRRLAHEREVAAAQSTVDVAAKREADATAELHRLSEDAPAPPADVSMHEQRAEALQAEIERETRQRDALVRAQERQAAALDHVAERERARDAFEAVSKLGAALATLQQRLADAAREPVVEHANRFLKRCGESMRVYFADSGDFGAVMEGSGRVPYWSLADSESGVIGAALASAFAVVSGAGWPALILDRLETLDRDRAIAVVKAAHLMVDSGEIANFIGAYSTTSKDSLPTGPWGEWVWLG